MEILDETIFMDADDYGLPVFASVYHELRTTDAGSWTEQRDSGGPKQISGRSAYCRNTADGQEQ
jgi:hypothetical protein